MAAELGLRREPPGGFFSIRSQWFLVWALWQGGVVTSGSVDDSDLERVPATEELASPDRNNYPAYDACRDGRTVRRHKISPENPPHWQHTICRSVDAPPYPLSAKGFIA